MKFLALSGSARNLSTNTAMLRAVAVAARPDHEVCVFDRIADLPVFSPDLEGDPLPEAVRDFVAQIGGCDGLILASPEYVRAIPGGLKNALDWLVSRDEIINKPIVLMHASHRGEDVLAQLRLVLATVSTRFCADPFLRFELMKNSPAEIESHLSQPANRRAIGEFIEDFTAFCRQ
ncbi:FMN reductase [Sulfitobacter porphyrae]|nr:FMN reductase [Sulfitobacter porphyrae]